MIKVSQREEKGITIFDIEGRIDSTGAVELDSVLQQAAAAGKHKIIVDMADVQYINSAGLRTLADVLTQCRAHRGELRLVALNPKVERVFKIIGFDRFFETYEAVEDALVGF